MVAAGDGRSEVREYGMTKTNDVWHTFITNLPGSNVRYTCVA